jgi:hypothetical protein
MGVKYFPLCAGEYSSLWVPVLCPAGQVVHHGGHDKEMTLHFLTTEAEFLDELPTKVLGVFLFAIHSQSPLQLCLEISSNSRNLLQFLEASYWTL